jgi:hypothetical protein
MTRDEAERQVSEYITGWMKQDKRLFLKHLSTSILNRECHGLEYVGRIEYDRWFEEWNRLRGRGVEWSILRITALACATAAPIPPFGRAGVSG